MKGLKLWVEREMYIKKWREYDFEKAAGIPYGEVKKLFDDSPDFEKRLRTTFKVFRGIAKAFQVPMETVLCEAELYSRDDLQPVSIAKLVESLTEEQKDLIGRLARQLRK